MKSYVLAVAVVALLLLPASKAEACSCAYSTPCNAFAEATAVFIGQVLEGSEKVKIEDKTAGSTSYVAGTVRFTVEQTFKGSLGGEVGISVSSNLGTSCGPYGLIKGERYVVYAYGEATKLSTGVCTRTSQVTKATEDLQFLRNLPAEGTGGRLSGRVWADKIEGGASPLSITVMIRDAENKMITTVTDKEGAFELTNLKPGKYIVEPVFPEHYISNRSKQEVTIVDRGCTNVGFEAMLNGRITGRAFDSLNRPVTVMLVLEPSDPQKKSRSIIGLSYAGGNGKFEITGIPPGSYLLSYELQSEGWQNNQKYYYPGVRKKEEAKVIKVELGQQLEGFDFQLPPEFTAQTVEGFVVWADGSPAANVDVSLLCPKNPKPDGYRLEFMPTYTRTDEQGRFKFHGYKGMSYWIEAGGSRKTLNQDKAEEMYTPARELILEKDVMNLKLVLSERVRPACGPREKSK